jgi:predicted permease
MRIPRIWRRRRRDLELTDDLQSYIELETDAGVSAGLDPETARRQATRKLGNVTRVREDVHDMYSLTPVDAAIADLRYAGRTLRQSRGFLVAALAALALGIGANTAIFQVLNAIRLRTLPVPSASELAEVQVEGGTKGYGITNSSHADITYPLWTELRRNQRAFSDLFAWGSTRWRIGDAGTSHQSRGLWVSGNLFPTLRITPWRGRLLDASDDVHGCGAGPVVVSYPYWQRALGGADTAIGQPIVLDGKTFQIVGVTPPDFFGFDVGNSFDVAVPLCAAGVWDAEALEHRNVWWLVAMGRLKPGWSVERAADQIAGLSAGLFAATVPSGYNAETTTGWRNLQLTVVPASRGVSEWREQYESSLWLLLGATGLVLLVACANLANLMLARASTREREFAVRVAMGASRARIIQQCLAESVLLAAGGTVLGGWLAQGVSRLLVALVSTDANPLQLDVSIDARVLVFTTLIATATCLACGLVPAWRASRADPQAAMRAGGRGLTSNAARLSFQRLLIVVQVALSVVLVVGAMLFVRSLQNLLRVDTGFEQSDLLFGIVPLSDERPGNAETVQRTRETILAGIRALPHVQAAATTTHLPLAAMSWGFAVRVPSMRGEQSGSSRFTWVSPGYFDAMRTPMRTGRDFTGADRTGSRPVAIVNETFVRTFLAGQPPLQARFTSLAEPGYPDTTYDIVGVVADTKYGSLRETAMPIAFLPIEQHPNLEQWAWSVLAIRSTAPVAALTADVQRIVAAAGLESDVVMWPLDRQIQDGLLRERLMSWLAVCFGVLAGLLAAIGIYGVTAYSVARRTSEIALRVALGARAPDVHRLVVRQASRPLVTGLIVGAAAALLAGPMIRALLYGLEPGDPMTMLAALALLLVVGLVAAWVPAARAARVSPVEGLRAE